MSNVDNGSEVVTPPGRGGVVVTVADVIPEGADAVSVVFAIPGDHGDRFAYRPGQFLTLRVPPSQQTGVGRAVLFAGQLTAHRFRAQGHGETDCRRVRIELVVRQHISRRLDRGAAAVGGRSLRPTSMKTFCCGRPAVVSPPPSYRF